VARARALALEQAPMKPVLVEGGGGGGGAASSTSGFRFRFRFLWTSRWWVVAVVAADGGGGVYTDMHLALAIMVYTRLTEAVCSGSCSPSSVSPCSIHDSRTSVSQNCRQTTG